MRKNDLHLFVTSCESIDEIRKKSFDLRSDELLGLAESLKHLVGNGSASFPIRATFPDPPDILLTMADKRLAIEVRRVTRQRLSEVSASLGSEEILELSRNLYIDKRARRDLRPPSGIRSGDFRAIKKIGEPLNDRGWVGNEWRDEVVSMLTCAIGSKEQLIYSYRANADEVWLTLIACVGLPTLMDDVTQPYIAVKIGDLARNSQFEKVLLIEFSSKTLDLSRLGC